MNITQINEKIDKLAVEEIANLTGFQKKNGGKIQALDFVTGFFQMLSKGGKSLASWALAISFFSKTTITKQALDKRLQIRHEDFALQFLGNALKQSAQLQSCLTSKLFSFFNKVYVEDSTCLKLPATLADIFPGPRTNKGPCATLRIQLRINLKSALYEGFTLQPYRDVDQKHAKAILSVLRPKDLVIRDRGYWSLEAFSSIMVAGAFFLSRYQFGKVCLDPHTQQPINLLQVLSAQLKKNQTIIDQHILLGEKKQVPVRLVAVQLPQEVYQSRRRKALKDRSQSANHSQEYLDLLQWSIFITNVEPQIWSAQDMTKAYGFRWRIEIIFKCWKSHFNISQLFENKQSLSESKVRIYCSLFLAFLVLFFVRWSTYFTDKVFLVFNKWASLSKLAVFIKQYFSELLQAPDLDEFLPHVAKACTYENRKDRHNFMELLYMLN